MSVSLMFHDVYYAYVGLIEPIHIMYLLTRLHERCGVYTYVCPYRNWLDFEQIADRLQI